MLDNNISINEEVASECEENAGTLRVDLAPFIDALHALRSGEKQEMVCPLCGGKVGPMECEGEHSVLIGCYSCDMRIELESKVEED